MLITSHGFLHPLPDPSTNWAKYRSRLKAEKKDGFEGLMSRDSNLSAYGGRVSDRSGRDSNLSTLRDSNLSSHGNGGRPSRTISGNFKRDEEPNKDMDPNASFEFLHMEIVHHTCRMCGLPALYEDNFPASSEALEQCKIRLTDLGATVGRLAVERLTHDIKSLQSLLEADMLTYMKFVGVDLWKYMFGRRVTNLQSRGPNQYAYEFCILTFFTLNW